MNLNQLDRKSLIALATSKGVRWASRRKSAELIELLSARSADRDADPGNPASEDVASASETAATDAVEDSPNLQRADVFGLDEAEGSDEPPAKEGAKGASIAGENDGEELTPGSSPSDNNRDQSPPHEPDVKGPVYDAEVALHEDLDVLILIRISDNKALARLPLQGLIGRGRTMKLREIRNTAREMELSVKPGFRYQ